MPTTVPAGYHVVFSDDFSHTALNVHKWFVWAGQPGSDPAGWWVTPRRVERAGMLNLDGTVVASGGNPAWPHGGEITSGVGARHAQVYGEYVWAMRSAASPGTSTIVLLWPKSNTWPPEIDLYESDGNARKFTTTLHYGTAAHPVAVQSNALGHDASAWHVYTAIWRPGAVKVLEDGAVVTSISSSHVPHVAMRLDIQTQALHPGATAGSTKVAWVVEYAPRA